MAHRRVSRVALLVAAIAVLAVASSIGGATAAPNDLAQDRAGARARQGVRRSTFGGGRTVE
jgi:hypothetical protein